MQERKVWEIIRSKLNAGIPSLLFLVTQSSGSSPGRSGFKMSLSADGKMEGSIGGGIMEHKFVELAKELLVRGSGSILLKKQYHTKEAARDQSGMICSGEQSIALLPLNKNDLPTVIEILHCIDNKTKGVLHADQNGLKLLSEQPNPTDYFFEWKSDEDWVYQENVGLKDTALIIGGGHVSLALSKLLKELDFFVRVYDDRSDLNTMEENTWADEKEHIEYETIGNLISGGKNVYAILVTFGYRPDALVIRQLIGKEFKYLGMMGSKAKVNQIFLEMEAERFSREEINKVHAPIGISIGSRSPAEIAVSIAAEMIQERNSGRP